MTKKARSIRYEDSSSGTWGGSFPNILGTVKDL